MTTINHPAEPEQKELAARVYQASRFLGDWAAHPDTNVEMCGYLEAAIEILFPRGIEDEEDTRSYEELTQLISETMSFLLDAGVGWRKDSWFRYHLAVGLDFLNGVKRRPYLATSSTN